MMHIYPLSLALWETSLGRSSSTAKPAPPDDLKASDCHPHEFGEENTPLRSGPLQRSAPHSTWEAPCWRDPLALGEGAASSASVPGAGPGGGLRDSSQQWDRRQGVG